MELITPNLGTIFWMAIIFGIVAFTLKRFAWIPILNALSHREDSIKNALKVAEEARIEVELLKEGNKKIIAEALEEKEDILRGAMNIKENILAEAKQKADIETQNIVERARIQIQNEKAMAITDLKKQVAELSLIIAEKVVRKQMEDSQEQQKMIKKLVEGIKLN